MTLHYVTGSIFDSPAVNLVNPVNCVGVMGAGLALEFKKRFPGMFRRYQHQCAVGMLRPGNIHFHFDDMHRHILCATTKDHWKDPSKLEWVESCIETLARVGPIWGDIALPQLGCGKGGLSWTDVQPLVEHYLAPSSVNFYLYTPFV